MTTALTATERSHSSQLPAMVGVALLVALGVAAGAARHRARAVRVPRPHTDRLDALTAYLHEHVSGADLAIQVVERLRRTQVEALDRQLFEHLYQQFAEDRSVVRALLDELPASSWSPKRLVGRTSGSLLKLMAGGAPGELSLFRTLEALAMGIQGKRCLWRALQSLTPPASVPGHRGLPELEADAIRQWEAVEQRRRSLAPITFSAAAVVGHD